MTQPITTVDARLLMSLHRCFECGEGFIITGQQVHNISQEMREFATDLIAFKHHVCPGKE